MSKSNPSRVHNIETTVIEPEFWHYGQWRRQTVQAEWDAAHQVYRYFDDDIVKICDRTGDRCPQLKSDLLESCRSNAWFSRHITTGELRIAANACHLRWCPVCAESRRNFIAHSVGEWIKDLKYPKLLTFTLKHSDTPLTEQINNLYTYFQKLRKRKDFAKKVTGGIWFFQVKLSKSSSQWHPHIHCVVDGEYMPKALLRRLWVEITDISMIVDIRSVKDPEGCAMEVARYAAKPGPLKDLNLNHAAEMVDAMNGRRICGTWGIGRKVSLRPKKFVDKEDWKSVGSFSRVMTNRKTDLVCMEIFHAWKDHTPLAPGVDCYRQEERDKGEHVLILNDSAVLDEIYNSDWSPP